MDDASESPYKVDNTDDESEDNTQLSQLPQAGEAQGADRFRDRQNLHLLLEQGCVEVHRLKRCA